MRGDWDTRQYRDGDRGKFVLDGKGKLPPGYEQQNSCQECHGDTGLDSSFLPGNNAWQGDVSGSDGIISFSPFLAPDIGFCREPEIDPRFKDLVRPRDKYERIDFVDWISY